MLEWGWAGSRPVCQGRAVPRTQAVLVSQCTAGPSGSAAASCTWRCSLTDRPCERSLVTGVTALQCRGTVYRREKLLPRMWR